LFYKINKEIKKTDKEFLRGRPKIEQFPVKNPPQPQSTPTPTNKTNPIPNKALGKIGSVPETRSSTRQREQQPQSKQPVQTSNSNQPLKRKREEQPVVKDELPTTSYNNTISKQNSNKINNNGKSNDKSKSNDDMFMTSANNDFQDQI